MVVASASEEVRRVGKRVWRVSGDAGAGCVKEDEEPNHSLRGWKGESYVSISIAPH